MVEGRERHLPWTADQHCGAPKMSVVRVQLPGTLCPSSAVYCSYSDEGHSVPESSISLSFHHYMPNDANQLSEVGATVSPLPFERQKWHLLGDHFQCYGPLRARALSTSCFCHSSLDDANCLQFLILKLRRSFSPLSSRLYLERPTE